MSNVPLMLRAYDWATHLRPMVARRHLQNRIKIDKEDPKRWRERLGYPSATRPDGTLIWFHGLGLGEVLSIRGLVHIMADLSDAHFLVTSGTKAAGQALLHNLPPRTRHQFLPIDAPRYRNAFLDHWRPDLCIWAEQDVWPGFVLELARRKIPQAHVVCRMHRKSWRKKSRFVAAYSYIYSQMALVTANDKLTQDRLRTFGITDAPVTGPIKPTAPPLSCDSAELEKLRAILGRRFVWITAPSHQADEELALSAHRRLLAEYPDALLIIAPRYPKRAFNISLPHAVRSRGEIPTLSHQVYLSDTFGDLGLLYRLAQAALIGGTNDETEGHSPWEAANLGNAILHGPCTGNFDADFERLDAAGAAIKVHSAEEILASLQGDLDGQVAKINSVVNTYRNATESLAKDLMSLV